MREPSGLWAILVVVSGISKWYMQTKQDEFHHAKQTVSSLFFSSDDIFLCPDFLYHTNERTAGSWKQATWKMSVGFHAEADVLALLSCDVGRLQMAT